MSDFLKHLAVPLIAPIMLLGLYFTPKEVFGCANRGYLALGVVLIATIAAIAATVKSVSEKRRGSKKFRWWMATTLILLSPIALLLGPLG